MPILECQCGMVMSIRLAHVRRPCLRCGRTALPYVWRVDRRQHDAASPLVAAPRLVRFLRRAQSG